MAITIESTITNIANPLDVKLDHMMTTKKLFEHIAGRSRLKRIQLQSVLDELNESIIYFINQGISVKIDGLGTFIPSIQRDGQVSINIQNDINCQKPLNAYGMFLVDETGDNCIDKTIEDIFALSSSE